MPIVTYITTSWKWVIGTLYIPIPPRHMYPVILSDVLLCYLMRISHFADHSNHNTRKTMPLSVYDGDPTQVSQPLLKKNPAHGLQYSPTLFDLITKFRLVRLKVNLAATFPLSYFCAL